MGYRTNRLTLKRKLPVMEGQAGKEYAKLYCAMIIGAKDCPFLRLNLMLTSDIKK